MDSYKIDRMLNTFTVLTDLAESQMSQIRDLLTDEVLDHKEFMELTARRHMFISVCDGFRDDVARLTK